ncbi:MAG: cob(I)yrinic acid a,c-diamide adenosyltransferase [Vicinamibacterales bacterium]
MDKGSSLPLIYTKTGDAGQTGLFDGTRVAKSDPRVEAYGEVDELGAWIGLARTHGLQADLDAMLETIQKDLFALGARLADPSHRISARVEKADLEDDDVRRLEGWIDQMQDALPPLRRFILAGGSPAGATLHLARTVCRRAERRAVALGEAALDPRVVVYLNRLSDFLFVIARTANHRAGVEEAVW